ncbi:Hsp70 family protein [Actinoplanes sp. KI2]|uniref:Hsp70 family protein n=1 Tax=Actinoplanes sp. KI2 TaxID=2983315 RepID=UPI0021D5C9DD|nr:Hsp70 family protein [Actinoplanes sp. KI2]MCU7730346.1 Hsp70 family protein [Actinoplanes sp. KI2]
MVEYGLGIDFGTTCTAAAVNVDGSLETVPLGFPGPQMPTLVYRPQHGEPLVGAAAEQRGDTDPARLARDFKRRIGDPVPADLDESPLAAQELAAVLLRQVAATAAEGRGGPPSRVVLTHPAVWGRYKRDRLLEAARLAGLPEVTLRAEPEALATRYAATSRVGLGETLLVYDLGGGIFDAAVLLRTADGFELLGEPEGVEQLGGADFDEAMLSLVRATLGDRLAGLDPDDPAVFEALARLRRECVAAKEALSFDTRAEIEVALPRLHTRVSIRRHSLEAMIGPAIHETVAAVRRALDSASVPAGRLRRVVLAGGSSRIPLVHQMVSGALGRPVTLLDRAESGIALGAAQLCGVAAPVIATYGSAKSLGGQVGVDHPQPCGPLPPATVVGRASVPGREPDPVGPPSSPRHPAWNAEPTAPHPLPSPRGLSTAVVATPTPVPAVAERRSYRWPVIGGTAAVLLAVTTVAAAIAWPVDRDDPGGRAAAGTPPSTSAPASGSAGGTEAAVLWRVATGAGATGPPAVSAQRIVVGGQDGTLRAFRRADGKLDWQVTLGAGLRVSTRIDGDVVVATTGDGEVTGIDADGGAVLWRRSVGAPTGARAVASSPLAYAVGRNGVLDAYRIGSGSRRWRLHTPGEMNRPPLVVSGIVVVASGDGKLYGVSPTGTQRWVTRVGKATDGPVAAGNAACVTIDNRTVRCVRVADGAELSGISQATPIVRIAGGRSVLYTAAADGSIAGWEPDTAKVLWRYPRPAKAGFPAAGSSEVDVAYPDGTLAGLDARSGEELWRNATGDRFAMEPASDPTGIFVVGTTGTLYALKPPP